MSKIIDYPMQHNKSSMKEGGKTLNILVAA